jgi:hypothetical protein
MRRRHLQGRLDGLVWNRSLDPCRRGQQQREDQQGFKDGNQELVR